MTWRWTAISPRYGIIKSDIPAFYGKYVEGIRMRDVQIDWALSMPDYFSDGIRLENFKNLALSDFSGRQAQQLNGAAIALQNGSGVAITNSRATLGARTFLTLDHVTDRRVFVNYDLGAAAKVIVPPNQRFDTQISSPNVRMASPHANTVTKPKP